MEDKGITRNDHSVLIFFIENVAFNFPHGNL